VAITPEHIDALGKVVIAVVTAVLAYCQNHSRKSTRCIRSELDRAKKDLDLAYGEIRFLKTGKEGLIRKASRPPVTKQPEETCDATDRDQASIEVSN
jgi:hypothetical protein